MKRGKFCKDETFLADMKQEFGDQKLGRNQISLAIFTKQVSLEIKGICCKEFASESFNSGLVLRS